MKNNIKDIFSARFFFDWDEEQRFVLGGRIGVVLLYVIGIYFGATFFNWGNTPLTYKDWHDINVPRIDVISDALHSGMPPLHVNCRGCLHKLTDRFLVLPDVITTPQMLLLRVLDIQTFIFLDLLLHYTAGTLGLLYLKKKFKFSMLTYSFLFFLFNFNGYILTHYAIGHATWAGYFLFPWFFVLVFHLIEGSANWQWVAEMSFLCFYIILAGGQHHFTWMMIFLAVVAISSKRTFKWALTAILFAGFLSAIRLLPPVLALNSFTSEGHFGFRTGYPSIIGFFSTLTKMKGSSNDLHTDLGYWEFDYYIGYAGLVFVLWFGVVRWLSDQWKQKQISALLIPGITVFLLSQGSIYKYTLFNLPLFASERVPSRMVSIPMTLFMIMGAVYFQEFSSSKNTNVIRWLSGISLAVLVNNLFSHLLLWKVDRIAPAIEVSQDKLNIAGNSIIMRSDPIYVLILCLGLGLTLITAIVLLFLVRRENKLLLQPQAKTPGSE